MERRRRIATYLMLAGLIGAGLLVAIGFWNYSRATSRINALVKDCEAVRRSWTFGPSRERSGHWEIGSNGVPLKSCDPDALEAWKDVGGVDVVPIPPGATIGAEHYPAAKVQAWYDEMQRFADRIAAENNDRENDWSDSELEAIAIALVLALPRLWYFLLGRLAELASAVRRNP